MLNLVHLSDPAGSTASALRALVRAHAFAIVRGVFDPAQTRASLARVRAGFDAGRDHKHDPADAHLVRTNYQKLQIGATSGPDHRRSLGRFLRVLYNPIFADDIYGLRETFTTLARFRNHVYDLPRDFAVAGIEQNLFTCARLHQYPVGGGFMVPHRDMFARAATEQQGLGYFQVFMVMSEKGRDFASGGAYVDVGDERIMIDDHTQAGDVVIYDGRTVHGVADVDPLSALDLRTFGGRVAAFASLFDTLRTSDYGQLARSALDTAGTAS